ncbi:MAG: ABC transporter permease [Actinobacteria bacterium]|nr:ABC transporter permease [Actinomycetota bacterium]
MVINRVLLGIVTLFLVSIITFAATQLLPGNAAKAVLGQSATPSRVAALEHKMGLDTSATSQYWSWLTGLLHGEFGQSLTANQSVSSLIGPRITNSAALVVTAGIIGTLLGVALGLLAALRRDKPIDHILSVAFLGVTALPEFVIGIVLIMVFATNVFAWFPAVSTIPPGVQPWEQTSMLVLPTATLVIIIIPYIFRMMRAATIEALESEYIDMARLKGASTRSIVLRHALPNAVAPTIQAIGLSLLYLAGGIVVVEVVFNYPGLGQALYQAVLDKDVPTIQFIVMLLAAVYVAVNILTDVAALLASPRRRFPR